MEKPELVLLAKTLSESTKEYVDDVCGGILMRMEKAERSISQNVGITIAQFDTLEKQIKELPLPEKGEKGDRGQDADITQLKEYLQSEITRMVALIPAAKDGKDGESISGPPGPKGADADMDQIKSYIQSEVAKTVLLMPIPKDGAPGKSVEGPPGPKGEPGKDAEPVHPDTLRLMIFEEVRKAFGSMVKPKDGEPGRDALQLDIQPTIDLAKSVPRGTFAKHAGGLWHAIRNTTPGVDIGASGWESIVDGVAQVEVAQSDNEREFTVLAKLSSGTYSKAVFTLPVLIFRGVYADGQIYQRGDTVTYSGSSWHCQKDGVSTRPGSGGDWCLMVKEGRKGIDAVPVVPAAGTRVSLK